MQGIDIRKQLYLPYACDSGDLRKLQIKQHMFLIVDNINSSPVHGYYHVILWQTGAWKLVSLVKSREQQRPLITSVVDNIFFDVLRFNLLSRVVSLLKVTYKIKQKQLGTWMAFPASRILSLSSISIHRTLSPTSLYVLTLSSISLHVFTLSPISLRVFTLSPILFPRIQTFLNISSCVHTSLILYSLLNIVTVCTLYRKRTLNETFCGRYRLNKENKRDLVILTWKVFVGVTYLFVAVHYKMSPLL